MKLEDHVTNAKIVKVDVERIGTSEDMQPRQKIDQDTIRRYRDIYRNAAPFPFPPIIAARLTDGDEGNRLLVLDGFHRVAAARAAGVRWIAGKVVEVSRTEAEWLAVKCNQTHGLPLSRKDHEEAFKRYVRAGGNRTESGAPKSYRAITADLGGMRGHATFQRWMVSWFPAIAAEMAGREDFEEVETSTTGDNATYMEIRLDGYADGAARTIRAMPKAQRREVERSPGNAAKADAEKAERAAGYARAAVLRAVEAVLAAAGDALGTDAAGVVAMLNKAAETDAEAPF